MEEPLGDYRKKRDFDATPEPSGDAAPASDAGDRFVIQEHHARRLHWDLRLERDGVLASFALPNGVPDAPGENRLAVRTEDHPLEYLEFQGDIPEGTYGAGTMRIWDRGTYAREKWEPAKLDVELRGERVQGRYALFRMRDQDWMIHRVDPPADPQWRAMAPRLVPMYATPGELPDDDRRWGLEIRWDGVRALALCVPGRVRLQDAVLDDLTPRYPELRALARALGHRHAVFDGEIVAFDEHGRPDRERLEQRAALTSERAIRRGADADPVVYVVYDLLHLDGRPLLDHPYEERRERLRELDLQAPCCQVPAHHVGHGAALLHASRDQGLAGIVAKRLDSTYEPGRRSRAWRAIGDPPRPPAASEDLAEIDAFYARVASALLPHLRDRDRRVDGVELSTSLALAGDLDHPTAVVLAVEGGGIADCCEVALLLRGMLDQLGLRSFAKTSGAGGLDVHVPVNVKTTYKRTQAFARAVAQTLERAGPGGDVRVDWSLNDRTARPVCAYSLRAGKRKTVSTPVRWDEVECRDARALSFGPKAVIARVEEHGDLFAPVLSLTQELPAG